MTLMEVRITAQSQRPRCFQGLVNHDGFIGSADAMGVSELLTGCAVGSMRAFHHARGKATHTARRTRPFRLAVDGDRRNRDATSRAR